jgi:hypothetical protein
MTAQSSLLGPEFHASGRIRSLLLTCPQRCQPSKTRVANTTPSRHLGHRRSAGGCCISTAAQPSHTQRWPHGASKRSALRSVSSMQMQHSCCGGGGGGGGGAGGLRERLSNGGSVVPIAATASALLRLSPLLRFFLAFLRADADGFCRAAASASSSASSAGGSVCGGDCACSVLLSQLQQRPARTAELAHDAQGVIATSAAATAAVCPGFPDAQRAQPCGAASVRGVRGPSRFASSDRRVPRSCSAGAHSGSVLTWR